MFLLVSIESLLKDIYLEHLEPLIDILKPDALKESIISITKLMLSGGKQERKIAQDLLKRVENTDHEKISEFFNEADKALKTLDHDKAAKLYSKAAIIAEELYLIDIAESLKEKQDNLWFTWSDDDGVTWSPPKKSPLWGYPAEVLQLKDGRVLVVYGYRKDPWGVRGCISNNGLTWDIKNEFIIREGGVPVPKPGIGNRTVQDMLIMAQYWHIGYPSATQLDDGTIIVGYPLLFFVKPLFFLN